MLAILGYAGILAALGGSIGLVVQGYRAQQQPLQARSLLRLPVLVQLWGAVFLFVVLEIALLTRDFSIAYVADNSTTLTPTIFTLASGWAALEGSIALWGLVLAGFGYLVYRSLKDDDGLGAGALVVLGFIGIFFFGLMVTVSNPFEVCTALSGGMCSDSSAFPFASAVAPLDGRGANPLLQNHILMAVHPPLLYVGYVGFAVPFSFAMSALARGDRGSAWLDRTHRWTLIAWTFLTAGIILGGWWSYEVLGWGGYWAWDPVENAAILPWLAGTAFIHSAIVQRRRGMLQAWNIALVISMFSLTILGTFLTRSGVIASVHSFTQSAVGPAILGFLAVTILVSFGLFAARSHLVASSPRLDSLASREGTFLLNNLLLTLFAFTVLVGTLYPILVEAFSGSQVSVGRPFFDKAAIPIALVLLLAMGVGPVTPYRVASSSVVWSRIANPLRAALVVGALFVLFGMRRVNVLIVIVLGTFVILVIGRHFFMQLKGLGRAGATYRAGALQLLRREPGYWGGQIAHIGFAVVAIAIAVSSSYGVRQEVTLARGESVVVEGYLLTFDGPFAIDEAHRRVEGAVIDVRSGDGAREIDVMTPRIHFYPNARQGIATPDVKTHLTEDLYLSLAGLNNDAVVLQVFVFPFIWAVWMGGFLVVVGGAWSFVGGRKRRGVRQPGSPVPDLVDTPSKEGLPRRGGRPSTDQGDRPGR